MPDLTRRTALAGAVALLLAPVATVAHGALPNGTDAAWEAYQTAKAAVDATSKKAREIAQALPEHLKERPYVTWGKTPATGEPNHLYSVEAIEAERRRDPFANHGGKIGAERNEVFDRLVAAFRERRAAWKAGRAEYGTDAADQAVDEAVDHFLDAERTMLEAPSATLVDVERKLSLMHGWDDDNQIQTWQIERLLADVRGLLGQGIA